jgi:hypothetical protein
MIMAAPHRGHAHVGPVAVSMVGVASVELAVVAGGSEQGPRERHARRPTGVGPKPRLSDPDEAARQDVLDEAAQKLHRGEGHRAPAVVVGLILPLKRDALSIEGEQPVIADRHPMGIAPETTQDGGRGCECPAARC